MLETQDLGIRFGGHQAVDGVSCRFAPGTLTALVGPNGAGKTTYFNLISGQLRPTAGRVLLDGRAIEHTGAAQRARLGLGRAFQLTNLFPNLSVRENLRLVLQSVREGPHRHGRNFWSVWRDVQALGEAADALLERIALTARAARPARELSHGDQRKLEVGMLMAMDPKVYLFDEPTAGMSADEAPVVLDLIRGLRADRTKTVLLVEHKLDVVRELADRIVVLHNGRLICEGDPATAMASSAVRDAYLGMATA